MLLFTCNIQKARVTFPGSVSVFEENVKKLYRYLVLFRALHNPVYNLIFHLCHLTLKFSLSLSFMCFLSALSFIPAATPRLIQNYLWLLLAHQTVPILSITFQWHPHFFVKYRLNFCIVSFFSFMALVLVCALICRGEMENFICTNLCVH